MNTQRNFKRPILLVIIALLLFAVDYYKKQVINAPITDDKTSQVELAFQNRQKDIQVTGSGKVIKLLADDLQGSRHQKFIVQMTPDFTVLIAHNIDLAPRINNLKQGDNISFAGEYEYNERGGVVHWTHHDPGKKTSGWLAEAHGKSL